ncbi:MAG: type II toxin-antitoxin system Phd/YefM family antitoxin [Gemmatimonadota bacterium]
MRHVPISDLKAKLSQYVDLVQRGEEVVVTDRGRPVARLVGLAGEEDREGRLQQLIRLGRVRPPVDRTPSMKRSLETPR